MIIGFTGTQIGMTANQKEKLNEIFEDLAAVEMFSQFHHGDCVGADSEAHDIAEKYFEIIIHPPLKSIKRAFKKSNKIMIPKSYLERNQNIVRACNLLIVCPKEYQEQIRSGTWFTFRQAQRNKKSWIIIYPNGEIRK